MAYITKWIINSKVIEIIDKIKLLEIYIHSHKESTRNKRINNMTGLKWKNTGDSLVSWFSAYGSVFLSFFH